jgi:hypothetical protein
VPGYPTTWGSAALARRVIHRPSWAFEALSGAAGAVHSAKLSTGDWIRGPQRRLEPRLAVASSVGL